MQLVDRQKLASTFPSSAPLVRSCCPASVLPLISAVAAAAPAAQLVSCSLLLRIFSQQTASRLLLTRLRCRDGNLPAFDHDGERSGDLATHSRLPFPESNRGLRSATGKLVSCAVSLLLTRLPALAGCAFVLVNLIDLMQTSMRVIGEPRCECECDGEL